MIEVIVAVLGIILAVVIANGIMVCLTKSLLESVHRDIMINRFYMTTRLDMIYKLLEEKESD